MRRLWALALAGLISLLSACSVMGPAPAPQPGPPSPDPTPPPRVLKAPKVALALGGGAARGFAHIGVIQVLEENGIKVDLVAGTSAGSLVAALYASGKSGQEMAKLAETMDEGAITDWSFPLKGLIKGEALARYVRQQTGGKTIEQLPVPLGIVATNLHDGSGVLFRSGDLGLAVRASSAVPAVFQPVEIGARTFVDGGLVAPVPVRYARQMGAEVVIAIDISSPPDPKTKTDPFSMLMQTVAIMGRNGMGKSTLLKSLMGLVKPSGGTVQVKGRDMTGASPYAVAREGIAYVPEGRGIFGNLSVKENLVMAARPGTRGQREWTYERVLDTFPRLAERLNHGGQQLSGGEQQMLTIGRALMTNPDLLILDEATEGLAPLIAREIWRICGLIRESGISSVIVDKNWKHVTQITDRNVILVKGEVVFEGATPELLAKPELLAQHLGV